MVSPESGFSTRAIHAGQDPDAATGATIVPIYATSTYTQAAPGQHAWVGQKLLNDGEPYLHLADLESYLHTHDEAARLYRDRSAWARKAILNVARVGKFSSDRTIREYARDIWKL